MFQPPLCGRGAELAGLKAALSQAISGRGGLVLLAGEPGIGKTRLADELAAAARAEGAGVHVGRVWEGGGAPAYWPWTEALGSLTAGLEGPRLHALVGADAPELARLLPELRASLPHLEAASLPDADEGRFRLARAVAAMLKRATAVCPRLLVLDDLHLADVSTLACLQVVARSAREHRLLVVGTYRDVEARLSPTVSEKIGVLSREATTVHLGRLDRDASRAVVAQQSSVAGAEADAIVEATGGNPLFLVEMSRLVATRGAAAELPLGVRESIRQRLALLEPKAIAVLECAACAGRSSDPRLLAAALGWAVPDVIAALGRAAQAGVVRGEATFSHDLVREVLYRELPAERRLATHRALADAVRALRPPGAASLIAHHLLESTALGREEAVEAALVAAGEALDVLAFEEALTLLDRARAVSDGVDRALQAQLWTAIGEARLKSGDVPGAKDACRTAAGHARGLGDAKLLARAGLAWGAHVQPGTVDPELVAWLEEAAAGLGSAEPGLKARVLGRLAAALQPAKDPEVPIRLAHEAIALARSFGDDRTLLEVIHAAMAALMDYVHPKLRRPLNLEQEALAQRFHDRFRELRARLRLYFDTFEAGDFEGADARAAAFESLAAELRQTQFDWFRDSRRAVRACAEGRWAEAEAAQQASAQRMLPGTLSGVRQHYQRMMLALARERRADVEQAIAGFGEMAFGQLQLGFAARDMMIAAAWARIGEPAKARARLAASIQDPAVRDFGIYWASDPLFCFAEVILTVPAAERAPLCRSLFPGHAEPLEALYAIAARRGTGWHLTMGIIGMSFQPPCERTTALLALALGRLDVAIGHFAEALATLEAARASGLLGRARFELAEALLTRGKAGDAERARGLIDGARQVCTELGQPELLAAFEPRLSQPLAPVAPALPRPAPAVAFSLAREGEYWAIRGSGAVFRLKDSRGLQLIARLVERPDQEIHSLELATDGAKEEVDGGDAGEWLDEDAKKQYRDRIEDLREELREAEAFQDGGRAAKAREELDFLAGELSRGVGLGGRSRKAGSAAERARVAVQRRIKDAIKRIGEHDEATARHLEWAVKTGTYCSYRPSR